MIITDENRNTILLVENKRLKKVISKFFSIKRIIEIVSCRGKISD